ncbi:MAG: hypothetical protein HOQ29_09390 [Acidobacteria bacterium]|nr:hypothetical protein [Acidobacteriota bacterium]
MNHPLVLALFDRPGAVVAAARALHADGVTRDRISVIARNHDEEGVLARELEATPGAEVEDSRPAALAGELSGFVLAAIAFVLPGVGPIVAAGPLSAGLGEAAGHVAGGIASALTDAGVERERAAALESEVERGAILLGVHVHGSPDRTAATLVSAGGREVQIVSWRE